MRHLRLRDNLGGAKGTVSRYLRRHKPDRGSAAATLNLERIFKNRFQLFRPQFEILFVRAFLNFRSTRGNGLAATAVGAGEATVTGFENEIGRAARALVSMDLVRG